jgi:hypothetical protein
MPINSFLYPGAKFIPGYEVANSCRFNRADSADMTLSMSSGGSTTKFTKSFWVKRCAVGEQQYLFDNSGETQIFFKLDSGDTCTLGIYEGGYSTQLVSTQLFRDVSAWYNFIIAVDYTNATQAHRARVYVNGTEITAWGTETRPSNDSTTFDTWNSSKTHYLGSNASTNHYFNGYLAEVVHIDNAQLTPTSFGEFDSDSPTIWKPKNVSGLTFGTKGHYLDFEDSDNLGDDESGNTADWTEVNLAATDQATDTPTNNFATYNPLLNTLNVPTFAEGNTQAATTGSGVNGGFSSIGVASGKWYVEFKLSAHSGTNRCILGVTSNPAEDDRNDEYFGQTARSYSYSAEIGRKYNNNSASSYGDSYTTDDILGVALDLDNLKIYFSKNGTWQDSGDPESGATGTGAAFTVTAPASTDTGNYFFGAGDESGSHSCTVQANFGNPAFTISSGNADANGYGNFEYSVPSGYYSLCSKNLAEYG